MVSKAANILRRCWTVWPAASGGRPLRLPVVVLLLFRRGCWTERNEAELAAEASETNNSLSAAAEAAIPELVLSAIYFFAQVHPAMQQIVVRRAVNWIT